MYHGERPKITMEQICSCYENSLSVTSLKKELDNLIISNYPLILKVYTALLFDSLSTHKINHKGIIINDKFIINKYGIKIIKNFYSSIYCEDTIILFKSLIEFIINIIENKQFFKKDLL